MARAQAPDPLRILVLEGPTLDWLRRVRGQLSDLPVSITTLALVVEGQAEPELLRQLGPLAAHRDAALVAWLITDRAPRGPGSVPGSTRVGIWFARSGRLFSRPLAGPWTGLSASDRSGVLELAALSVRSAARSLLLDPTQAEPFPDPEPARPTPAAPARAAAAADGAQAALGVLEQPGVGSAAPDPAREQPGVGSAAPDPALPQDGPSAAAPAVAALTTDAASGAASSASGLHLALHWSAELGALGQLPGPPAYGALGFAAGVRARSGAWGAVLLGQLGLPVRSKLGPIEIDVLQHALLVEGQYLRWNTGAWSFGPLARAGVRWARRATVAGDPALDASAVSWQRALRLGLGWTTELHWGTHWGITLRGVLHWEPARPSYAVLTTAGDPVSNAQPWAVQPSLEIAGNWYW